MFKESFREHWSIILGALIVVGHDLLRLFIPGFPGEMIRFAGTGMFIIGVLIEFLIMDARTKIAMATHDRMFKEIHDLQVQTGSVPTQDVVD
jgi:hypothetical protein